MKRILIRALLALVVLFIVIAGSLSLSRGLGGSRLEKFKRELRSRGEKLLLSELAPPTVVSNPMIARLSAAHKQLTGSLPHFDLMHSNSLAWKSTNNWPDLHKLLDESAARRTVIAGMTG